MTSPMPIRALGMVRDALAAEPAGLLTDLDGTLAPIVADPGGVALDRGATAALAALARRLAVVGIVTGRAAADARAITGLDRLLVVGNHGLEWLAPGSGEAEAPADLGWVAPALARWMRSARDAAADPGVTLDDKGLSATLHYRRSDDPSAARRRILAALAGAGGDRIDVREGRMSVELRPAGVGDKGAALRAVVVRYALRGLVVAGDDVTDLDMFRAAAELRSAGTVRAAILAVGTGDEVPSAVAAAADAVLPSPAAMVDLLAELARDVSDARRSPPGR